MNPNLRRALTAVTSTAVVSITAIAPVFASGTNYDDGEERGTPMTLTQAVLWFVVTPIVASFGIALLVSIPTWVRKAKQSTVSGFIDDPTLADRQVGSPNRNAIGS